MDTGKLSEDSDQQEKWKSSGRVKRIDTKNLAPQVRESQDNGRVRTEQSKRGDSNVVPFDVPAAILELA